MRRPNDDRCRPLLIGISSELILIQLKQCAHLNFKNRGLVVLVQ